MGAGTVSVASGGTFAINRSDAVNFSALIDGPGAVASNGNGSLSLTASNTFAGPIVMSRGVLRVTPATLNGLGVGNKSITAANRNAGIELDGGVTLPNTIGLTLSNDGDLTQAGATVPFAVHSATGFTNTINGDIGMKIGGGGVLLKVDAGGTLIVNGNVSIQAGQGQRAISLGGSGTGVINGIISNGPNTGDNMQITVAGTGSPSWTLNNANTNTGTVAIQSGTLTLLNNQALGQQPTGGANGTFCFIGNGSAPFAGLNSAMNIGADMINIPQNLWTNKDVSATPANNLRTLGFTGVSGTGTFSGSLDINGGAVLRSMPAGTLVMSGLLRNGTDASAGVTRDVYVEGPGNVVFGTTNSYTGFTHVDAGTLTINSGGGVVSSDVTVASGATLNVNGASARHRPSPKTATPFSPATPPAERRREASRRSMLEAMH